MNQWYAPENFEEWILRTEDRVNIFVREVGMGETFIVLHGGWGAEHSYMLDPLLSFQNQVHFVFYDQRGSLRSPCPVSKITLPRHVEDLERLRKELKLERLSLLCHSMGSYLGMQYAKQYPGKVKKLVLISPVPFFGSKSDLTDQLEPVALARWKREEVVQQLAQNNIKGDDLSKLSSKERGIWHRITFSAINLHSVLHWKKMRGCFYHQLALYR
ncbi:MAG: alpha/beta hydrolase [Caldisericia bacterium]|nr:alpha/beta hydrolase [Caldisericia bacterium]